MNPSAGLIPVINARLGDATFRQQIRDMHARQTPLVDMVDQLGLAAEMSDQVRAIVEGLTERDVAGIRQATLDMLDRAENALPVDCNLSQTAIDSGSPLAVAVVDETGRAMIQVRASRSA